MSKRLKNIIINIIIILLLTTSVVLIFKNQIREYLTSWNNNKVITAFRNNQGEVNIPWWQKWFTDQSNIKLTDSMLGILKIDDLKIEEPIFQGDSEINLINGVATVDKNQTLDAQNVVLAGHSVQGVDIRFYNLNKIKKGTKVQIFSKDKLRTYEVDKIYDVVPTQVEILDQHDDQPKKLTMFTCDSYNPNTGVWETRFVVEAKLIGEESA